MILLFNIVTKGILVRIVATRPSKQGRRSALRVLPPCLDYDKSVLTIAHLWSTSMYCTHNQYRIDYTRTISVRNYNSLRPIHALIVAKWSRESPWPCTDNLFHSSDILTHLRQYFPAAHYPGCLYDRSKLAQPLQGQRSWEHLRGLLDQISFLLFFVSDI